MSNSSKIIIIGAIIIALVLGFGGGYITSQAVNGLGVFVFNPEPDSENWTRADTIDLINEAWLYLENEFVEPDRLASENISASAIRGMIAALGDPHMTYLTADDFKVIQTQFSGSFEGIGAVVSILDGELTIVSVFKGAPAEQSGMVAGDIIKAVNGESIAGLSIDVAVSKIRGDAGTTVDLLVLHPDAEEPVTITITRAEVEVPSVDYELIDGIAVISIYQFNENTDEELQRILPKLEEDDARGIVLDLRDNPGGILTVVVDVASHFITDGVIISVRSNQGVIQTYDAVEQKLTTDLPIVVLVNGNSASGSEVLAGALQDYQRALIAGTTTYGKGSVNILQPLSDGSGLYITSSRWLTPNGNIIEGQGIEPDVALEVTGGEQIDWAIDFLLN